MQTTFNDKFGVIFNLFDIWQKLVNDEGGNRLSLILELQLTDYQERDQNLKKEKTNKFTRL